MRTIYSSLCQDRGYGHVINGLYYSSLPNLLCVDCAVVIWWRRWWQLLTMMSHNNACSLNYKYLSSCHMRPHTFGILYWSGCRIAILEHTHNTDAREREKRMADCWAVHGHHMAWQIGSSSEEKMAVWTSTIEAECLPFLMWHPFDPRHHLAVHVLCRVVQIDVLASLSSWLASWLVAGWLASCLAGGHFEEKMSLALQSTPTQVLQRSWWGAIKRRRRSESSPQP
jgi:hypothetical protein